MTPRKPKQDERRRDATLREDTRRRVPAPLEREHTGRIGHDRENLEVEHQLHVLVERIRNTRRCTGQFTWLTAAVALLDQLDATFDFAIAGEPADDVTVLAMTFSGRDSVLLERTIPAARDAIGPLVADFEQFAVEHHVRDEIRRGVLMALDELITNVVSYGFQDGAAGEVHLHVELSPRRLAITVSDGGVPFDPLAQPEPDTTAPVETRAIGGLGILLVRKMMDDVTYQRSGTRNVVTFMKLHPLAAVGER